MAFNLLETVRGYLTPDVIEKASAHLGEPSSGIGKAVSAAVPALLGMFVNRAEGGDAQGLLNDAREAANSNVLSNPQSLFTGGIGSVLSGGLDKLTGLFGSNTTGIVSAISSFAGIKSGSVQGLLAMLAPLGLGALGRHVQDNNLSAQGLTSYLSSQKTSIMSALPAGLSLGSLFGDSSRTMHAATPSAAEHPTGHRAIIHDEKKTNWLPWLLLALGAIALIYFLTRNGCNNNEKSPSATDTTTTAMDTSQTTMAAPVTTTQGRESTMVKLADGTEINAYKGGVEDKLVACLDDAACAAGKDKWFDFDNINFETGSARLTSESQSQVQNIVAVLKAYPKAKIKIGGYTDKTGNAAANKTLSQQRADAVLNAIKAAGANTGQLVGAEGYGSEFAKVAADASDEERRTDRRIAVQLREK